MEVLRYVVLPFMNMHTGTLFHGCSTRVSAVRETPASSEYLFVIDEMPLCTKANDGFKREALKSISMKITATKGNNKLCPKWFHVLGSLFDGCNLSIYFLRERGLFDFSRLCVTHDKSYR
ncbi:hypothetical protein CEXT_597651 [Caerostris extrusa]|uniref:Uncharacterized protein n=1 Tax=Caerostris extrusa TaxID=172846 RepID=A0AAV4RTC4_CAEEX|nr:hypothetical protein CEXT_597651 [Caerostris extrusa]